MPAITEDLRAIVESAHLCFAATVSLDGKPNLSPKGTIRVWDDEHLFFLDIASPGTRENLENNPYIEVNIIDQLSRRGYRVLGKASLHRDDQVHKDAMHRVFGEEGAEYPVECVVLINAERVLELASPGYMHIHTEAEMRAMWRNRRATLDKAFDAYAEKSPFRPFH